MKHKVLAVVLGAILVFVVFFYESPIKKEKPKTLPEVLVQNMKDNPRDWVMSDSSVHNHGLSIGFKTYYYVNKKCNIMLKYDSFYSMYTSNKLINLEMFEPDTARFVGKDFDLILGQIELNEKLKEDSLYNIKAEKERLRQDLIANKISICK